MNTTKFVNNLESENISEIVTRYFDEIMVLYNLVGHREGLNISAESNTSLATFRLNMENDEEAKMLYDSLNNSSFSVYNDQFDISMNLSGSSVLTTIVKAASK